MVRPQLLHCALAVVTGLATASQAQSPAPPDPLPAQEQADSSIVQQAMIEAKSNGLLALQKHVVELRQVLDRAPAAYPEIVRDGDVIVIRNDDPGSRAPELLGAGLAEMAKAKTTALRVDFNTYPMAAFLLGSFGIEARRPDLALPYLDRGLAIQPGNEDLTAEKAHALYALHRPTEGLKLVEDWLAAHPLATDLTKARYLRSKGFGLTELGRLDEAETAYQASLKLEPGHALALNELRYIRRLRGGGAKSPAGAITSDKARREAPKAPSLPTAAAKPS